MIVQAVKENGDQISKLEVQFYCSSGPSNSANIPIFLTPNGRFLAYADNPCFNPDFNKSQAKNYNQVRMNIFEIFIDINHEKLFLKPFKTIDRFDEVFRLTGGIDSFY